MVVAVLALALVPRVGMPVVGAVMTSTDTTRTYSLSADTIGVASLDAFWMSLDLPWYEPQMVRDMDLGLSDAGLDSLVGEGDREIVRVIAG